MNENKTWQIIEEFHNGNKLVKEITQYDHGYYGMVDKENKIICELKYSRIYDFNEGIGILELDEVNYGYVDINGNIICECIYRYTSKFKNGLARVSKEHGWYGPFTLINRFGIEVLPSIFTELYQSNNYIIATRKNEYSAILLDHNLNIIFDSDKGFREIREIKEDVFIVNIKGVDHLVNLDGVLLTSQYLSNFFIERHFEIIENIIQCSNIYPSGYTTESYYYTYFNLFGEQFSELFDIFDSRRLVRYNGSGSSLLQFGYLDESGKIIIPCTFDYADNFINGNALVERNYKYFFIDINGNKVKDIYQYDYFGKFYNSLAIVEKNGLFGIINANGNEIINCKFNKIARLENGLYITQAHTENENRIYKYGLINYIGIEILPPIYDKINEFYNGRAVISLENKFGFINTEGNIIIPLIYDIVEHFENHKDTTGACIGDKWTEIDKSGKVTSEDFVRYFDDGSSYSENELRDMNREAFDGFPDAEWNVD